MLWLYQIETRPPNKIRLPFIFHLQPPGYPLIDNMLAVPDAGVVAHGIEPITLQGGNTRIDKADNPHRISFQWP